MKNALKHIDKAVLEAKLQVKLSKKKGYVRVPLEAMIELSNFAADCAAADDAALKSCSKTLTELLSEFTKALDRIHDSDPTLYFRGILAQADAIVKKYGPRNSGTPQGQRAGNVKTPALSS